MNNMLPVKNRITLTKKNTLPVGELFVPFRDLFFPFLLTLEEWSCANMAWSGRSSVVLLAAFLFFYPAHFWFCFSSPFGNTSRNTLSSTDPWKGLMQLS